ncbi:membrane protein [Anopheles sinensis]|uniref:Membrane protein n=1 Tax=Anopheles sinensis TaxID=74873 RepID=A0A084VSW7_ANOSI|nr:membrane protein [Anopheles sinensis]
MHDGRPADGELREKKGGVMLAATPQLLGRRNRESNANSLLPTFVSLRLSLSLAGFGGKMCLPFAQSGAGVKWNM